MGNKNSVVSRPGLTYSFNPHGKNKAWVYEDLTTGFIDRTDTIDDIKAKVKFGYAITGAHFNGQRRNTANVTQVGLLLVDIDNGMTIDEAKADPFIQEYCATAYTTHSHSPKHHKFRLIFVLPKPMERSDFECFVKIFLTQFPHDPSCKDAGRAFYGNTQAEFFLDNPDAILPQEWINKAIAAAKAKKKQAEKERLERLEWLKNNPPYICPDAIPLLNCCSREVRALVNDGIPAGAGHNDAALKVLFELVGVERHLNNMGQTCTGSARDYYNQFLLASGVNDHKAEGRWEWVEARTNTINPSMPPEIIQSCIYAHEFSQLRSNKERDQYRKEHPDFKPINGDVGKSTNQFKNKKVVPINWDREETNISIEDLLNELVLKHLNQKNLCAEIAGIAQFYKQSEPSVWRIYNAIKDEIEADDYRNDTKQELSQLQEAESEGIELDHIFPQALAESINKFMGMLNLRPETGATALITGISSVMPSKTKILINQNLSWTESPGTAGAMIGPSGTKKSPIMNTFMIRPLAKLQVEENERYENALKDYQEDLADYEEMAKSKTEKHRLSEEYPDGIPQPPKKNTWFYTNATIEKLKTQMADQPEKGILLAVDELAGLFGNMNAYRGGKGSDRQDLMSMRDGSPVSVGRKNGDVFIESPLLSIFGTIQPKVLQKILGDGSDSDGFFARFCFVRQPAAATILPELTDQSFDISPMIEALYRQVAALTATTYRLSPEGYAALKRSADAYEQKRVSIGDHPMANIYGKNGGRIGELSMLLHVIKHCFVFEIPPDVVEMNTVKAAITLVDFYTNQSRSIYAELDNQSPSIAPHLLKIVNLAKSKGTLTPRTVYKFIREMEKVKDKIPSYFDELEKMGLGKISKERTIKFTLSGHPSVGDEVGTSGDKVETSVGTSNPLHSKASDEMGTNGDKKNAFFISPQLDDVQIIDHKMSPFVGPLPPKIDTESDQDVPTLSAFPSPLSQNVPTLSALPSPLPQNVPTSQRTSLADEEELTNQEKAANQAGETQKNLYPQTNKNCHPNAEQNAIINALKSAATHADLVQVKRQWDESSVKWVYNYRLTAEERSAIKSKTNAIA